MQSLPECKPLDKTEKTIQTMKALNPKPHRNQFNKTKQLRIDTTVSSGYTRLHTHGLGIWKNPRVPMTVRVDGKLKTAFVEASKAFSGSTCSAIEYIMAAYVGVAKTQQINGVYPTLTMNPITIGEIKIERNLRERRKLPAAPSLATTVVKCQIKEQGKPCGGEAVGKAEWLQDKRVLDVCGEHLAECVSKPKEWRVL